MFPVNTNREHFGRRAFLKGALATAGGTAVANWGGLFNSQTIAQEAARSNKRCILLWMNGGASQIDTFDMKPGRSTGGPFRPISTNVNGIQICEVPAADGPLGRQATRSFAACAPITGPSRRHLSHAHLLQDERADASSRNRRDRLPITWADPTRTAKLRRMGSTVSAHSALSRPAAHELAFHISQNGQLPYFTAPASTPEAQQRRGELLNFMEQHHAQQHRAEPLRSRIACLTNVRCGDAGTQHCSTFRANGPAQRAATATPISAEVVSWPAS